MRISKLSNVFLLAFILVWGLVSCEKDNATDPTDEKDNNTTQAALAANNTIVTPEKTIDLDKIHIYHNTAVKQYWMFIDSPNKDSDGFTLKIYEQFPTASSGKLSYLTSPLEIKADEFQISEIDVDHTSGEKWYTDGVGFNINTTGNLYYKKNSNGTISFWVNKIKLANKTANPTKHAEFSFKFTFDENIKTWTNVSNAEYDELKSEN